MGWTTTSDYERHHKGLFTIREYLDREFACDNPNYPRHEILDSAMHGRTEYYAAVRSTDRTTGESVVSALVALVSYKPRDPEGQTLGWKTMSETMHPYCYACPERILALLDPPGNADATEWRRLCREKRASAREARAAFRHGAIVRFEAPMTFSGGVVRQRFTVERDGRKLRFRGEDGVLCRIPKAASRPFSVVEHVG